MDIQSIINNGLLTVIPKGRIDSASGDAFNSFLNEKMNDKINKISFNFKDVDFISSKGLRVLVSVFKNLNGKEMEIMNCNASVYEVFKISGLLNMFNIK